MNAVMAVIGVAFGTVAAACMYKRKDIVELLVYGITLFLAVYAIISGLLFWGDWFSIRRALAGVLIAGAAASASLTVIGHKRPTCSFSCRHSVPVVLILAVFFPAAVSKFGMYGTGQDQGLYQARAIAFICGYNRNVIDFEEYHAQTTEAEKQAYENEVSNVLTGFYPYDENVKYRNAGDYTSKAAGVLHGIPTFSALLALWGSIFGISRMMGIQTLFWMIGTFFVYWILKTMRTKTCFAVSSAFVFAGSPLILWLSKTSLVELFTAVLMLYLTVLFTDLDNPQYSWLACIPAAAFAFFHVSVYVMLPLFVLLFCGMYLMLKRGSCIAGGLITLAAYYMGYQMMITVNPVYTYGNYDRLYIAGINADRLTAVVTAAVSAAAVLLVFVYVVGRKRRGVHGFSKTVWKAGLRISGVLTLAGMAYIYFRTSCPVNFTTLYGYAVSTGIILLVLILGVFLIGPGIFRRNSAEAVLIVLFLYCVVVYSSIFKREIIYYYYYARYIVPYLPFVLLLGGYLAGELCDHAAAGRGVRQRKKTASGSRTGRTLFHQAAAALCILYCGIWFMERMPFNAVIATQQDETEAQWHILENLSEKIPNDSAVVMDAGVAAIYKLPVKFLTGADCYPAMQDAWAQLGALEGRYEKVYYLTARDVAQAEQTVLYAPDAQAGTLHCIYTEVCVKQFDYTTSEQENIRRSVIPFSKEFTRERYQIYLYQCSEK